jgi:hypothetical protein
MLLEFGLLDIGLLACLVQRALDRGAEWRDKSTPSWRDDMPTLLRLLTVLIVLGCIGLAGMVALTIMVDPGEKDVTIRIPTRELAPTIDHSDPLNLNDLPAPVNVAPKESSAEPSVATSDPAGDESGVETVEVGGAE